METERIRLNAEKKRELMSRIGAAPDGLYHFGFGPARPKHSDDQREYFYAGPVTSFARFIMHHDDELTKAQAKAMAEKELKERFLEPPEPVTNEDGVVIATPPLSIKGLDSAEIAKLSDKSNAWLANEWGVYVMTPEEYFASLGVTREEYKAGKRRAG